MNKTFDGHTPNENSSLDLDRNDTHKHNIETKRCKVNNDSANLFVALPFRSYWCKRMKKLHADGLLESLDYESLDACEPCLMGKMTKFHSPEQWSEQQICWKSYILMYVVR